MNPFEFKNTVAHAVITLRGCSNETLLEEIMACQSNLAFLCSNEAKITSFDEFKKIRLSYLILIEVLKLRKDGPKLIQVSKQDTPILKKTSRRISLSLVK